MDLEMASNATFAAIVSISLLASSEDTRRKKKKWLCCSIV